MEKLLSDKTIDNEIKENLIGLSPYQKDLFKQKSNTGWFRSYARKSNEQLKKITKKVKAGIAHGKYGDTAQDKLVGDEKRGYQPPKEEKKKKKKGEIKSSDISKRKTKSGKVVMRSYSPKTIKRVLTASKKYPDASNYEQRHGVNSKASQKYRINQGQSKEYKGRIIIKEKK